MIVESFAIEFFGLGLHLLSINIGAIDCAFINDDGLCPVRFEYDLCVVLIHRVVIDVDHVFVVAANQGLQMDQGKSLT